MKQSNAIQNGPFNMKMQNLKLVNLKCVTYAQHLPLFFISSVEFCSSSSSLAGQLPFAFAYHSSIILSTIGPVLSTRCRR